MTALIRKPFAWSLNSELFRKILLSWKVGIPFVRSLLQSSHPKDEEKRRIGPKTRAESLSLIRCFDDERAGLITYIFFLQMGAAVLVARHVDSVLLSSAGRGSWARIRAQQQCICPYRNYISSAVIRLPKSCWKLKDVYTRGAQARRDLNHRL